MDAILKALLLAVEVANAAHRLNESVGPYFKLIGKLIKKEPLTAAEMAQLKADRKRLSAALQEPLPPEST